MKRSKEELASAWAGCMINAKSVLKECERRGWDWGELVKMRQVKYDARTAVFKAEKRIGK